MPEVPPIVANDAARTWLFVPGDRPERFAKARSSGADAVIIDLEDAVAAPSKELARRAAAATVAADDAFAVRVSSPGSADGARDIEDLASAGARPRAVVVAKAEDPTALAEVGRILGAPVIALIESARGLEAAADIAKTAAVVRLALGAVDLSLDLGSEPDDDVLAPVRSRLVVASRVASIAPPIDSPSLSIADSEGVRAAAATARRFGMGGKLCIHPAQVPHVAAAFLPTASEIERARSILTAAAHHGAAQVDGQMIDLPVIARAQRVLADAESAGALAAHAGANG